MIVTFPRGIIRDARLQHGFEAHVEAESGKWDCGLTRIEAVSTLRQTWPETAEMDVKDLDTPPPSHTSLAYEAYEARAFVLVAFGGRGLAP